MIISVKSFMAAVMATILVLAVVLPIAGAMTDLSREKVYSNNVLEEGEYLMSELGNTKNPRLAVIDDANGVQLSVKGHHQDVTSRTVIFGDTFVVEFTANQFKLYYNEDDTNGWYSSSNGDYIAFQNGHWTLYKYTEDNPGGKSEAMTKEQIIAALDDPDERQSLIDRIPASNREEFTLPELEEMARIGVDVTRSVTAYKTGHYHWIVYPDPEGDLFYAIGNRGTAYVDSDSTIYTAGASIGTDGRAVLKGTLSHMEVVHSYYEIDPADIVCEYTPSGYSNVLTGITYQDETDAEYDVSHFIIPVKYTSDKVDTMAGALVGLVPVVLIVGLIVAMVSVHVMRKGSEDL